MSKIIKITLGGKERVIDIGKGWFMKFYGQVSGEDPLNSKSFLLNPERQFDFIVNSVYAGMMTDYAVNKVQIDFTKENIEQWVGELEDEGISYILSEYVRLKLTANEKKDPEPGEDLTQAGQS